MNKIKLADWDKIGKITKYEYAVKDHIDAIKKIIRSSTKRKLLVLDCGNGTACMIAPRLMTELGVEVISINSHPDGRFPGRPSEPTETNVSELKSAVVANKADAGIAWDGDGDRVIFVDEKGEYIIGDKVFALSILWRMGSNASARGDVVTTVATSKVVEDVASRFKAKVRYTAIGAPYLCEEMAKKPASIGGEEVGGVIFPELSMAKDGFLTAAKLVEAIGERPLSAWLKEIPQYHTVKLKIEADPKDKKAMVSRALDHAKKSRLRYTTVDGIRIDFDDAWVIVRASGTEGYVRLFAEARSKEKAEALAKEYKEIVGIQKK